MRILHTADWHLGRIFHGVHLTEDQAHVLDQFIEIARDIRPDAIVIAGDVYDRAVAPSDAIHLLDDVLSRIVLDLNLPVILIAGNHDAPERLGFGSSLLAQSKLHVFGRFSAEPNALVLADKFGPVHIYAIPFAEPVLVHEKLGGEAFRDHSTAWKRILKKIHKNHPPKERSVLVAHAAALGGSGSDSERPLSIGGSETVEPGLFSDFDYVALGHLHQAQSVGSDVIQYAGSILKYSFSEISHKKSVTLLDMDEKGNCQVERIPLSARRDLRRIEGKFDEILKAAKSDTKREDYLLVSLLDRNPIFNAMGRLREFYPNTLHIERPRLGTSAQKPKRTINHKKMTELELFEAFFSQTTGEELGKEERKEFISIIEELHTKNREEN